MRKGRKILLIVGGVVAVLIIAVAGWLVIDTGIEATSQADFCGSCHAMEPMVAAYHASVHGGNNPWGVAARCTDCHTSHENAVSFLFTKALSGTRDILVTWTTDELSRDWQSAREERREFVYDSGCLSCHRNLAQISSGREAHAKYFSGLIDRRCVDCHPGVGHEGLNRYLLLNKYRYYEGER